MGTILKKSGKLKRDNDESTHHSELNTKLYKPLKEFKWKDANKKQKKELAISAYRKVAY